MPRNMQAATDWEKLTIANDFVFCKAMLDDNLCKAVLEAVLGIEIDRVEHVERQHMIDVGPESKSVRLDVYVKDDKGTVYDVEMQVCRDTGLTRRARYYHAQMAIEQLEKGDRYRELPNAFAIFFCLFDPFGLGSRVYSFENRCREREGLALGDGATTLFLAVPSPTDESQSDCLNSLLDYIASGTAEGELPRRVDERVKHVIGSTEWRREYMLLEWRDQDNIDKGYAMGKQDGEERLGTLIARLLEQGRVDDATKAATSPAERERLMRELDIEHETRQTRAEYAWAK